MTRRRRPEVDTEPPVDPIAVAMRTPDAVAVTGADGRLTGWEESAAHDYLAEHGLPSDCDAACVGRQHVTPC